MQAMQRSMQQLILVVFIVLAQSATGQTAKAVAEDETARMIPVAKNTYVIIHDNATDDWPHGNTGVIVTAEGVVVVDSAYLPSRATADIALIRKITSQPVRYVLNTHWHFDHNNGTIAYKRAYPGLKVVSERATKKYIELNATWWSRMSVAPGSPRRRSLADLEKQLETGKDEEGNPLSESARRDMAGNIRKRKSEFEELATLEVVVPDVVFDKSLVLTVGDRKIELRDLGHANSPNDVVMYLPDEKVLFTGDIVVESPLPFVGASWPVTWVAVLREIEQWPAQGIVPGHGPIMRDASYVRNVRTLLETAMTQVEMLAREGKTLEQIQDAVTLTEIRKQVPAWNTADNDAGWKAIMRVLVERCWRGVRGQG